MTVRLKLTVIFIIVEENQQKVTPEELEPKNLNDKSIEKHFLFFADYIT